MVDDDGQGTSQDAQENVDESALPNFGEIDPQTITPEQAEELIKANQTLLGQNKSLKKRVENPPEAVKPVSTVSSSSDIETRLSDLEIEREKRQFGFRHGLSPEETDYAFGFAKGNNLKPEDTLKHEFFKTGLDSYRAAKRTQEAIPNPSGRQRTYQGKNFSDMTKEERREAWKKM